MGLRKKHYFVKWKATDSNHAYEGQTLIHCRPGNIEETLSKKLKDINPVFSLVGIIDIIIL